MIVDLQAYQCDKCKQAWGSKEQADNHHCSHDKHCEDCGVLLDPKCYYTVCDPCRTKREAQREAERFEKSTKMTVEEYEKAYPDQMFCDGEETYEGEFETLADVLYERTGEYPKYVWGTEKNPIELDDESIAQILTENDNVFEDYDLSNKALEDIHKFVEQFNKEHGTYSFTVNYEIAILAPEQHAGENE